MNTKNKIKTTIFLLMLILTIYSATALTFTQLIQSETTNPISKIRTTGNFMMAMDDASNIFYWNSTNFQQINKPTGETFTTLTFEKASNKKFYFTFGNTTTQKIYEYAPNNTMDCSSCWTLKQTINNDPTMTLLTTHDTAIACIDEGTGYTGTTNDAECWTPEINNTLIKGIKLINASNNISYTKTASENSLETFESSTRIGFLLAQTGSNTLTAYEYTGTTVTSQVSFGTSASHSSGGYSRYSDERKAFMGSTGGSGGTIKRYNSTLGTYQSITASQSTSSDRSLQLSSNGLTLYYNTGGSTNLLSIPYYPTNGGSPTTEFTAGQNIQTLDQDWDTGNFWVGANNGLIYNSLTVVTPPVNSSFDLISSINPNPTLFGNAVTYISATTSHPTSSVANVTITIRNSTGQIIDGTNCYPTNNGESCILAIFGEFWNNYSINQNYNVTFNSVWANSDTITKNLILQVIGNTTANLTNYTNIEYSNTGFNKLVSLDNLGDNRIFASAKNGSDAILISFDVSNPNNMIIKSKTIASGIEPTGISIATNKGYYATDSGLYAINNTQNGDASITTISTVATYSLGLDYVYDLSQIDNTLAWTCGDNNNLFVSDQAELYNFTTNSFQNSLSSTNPCLTIEYDSGITYIHKGTSGLRIYNFTTLLSTINSFASQPSGATNDRISIYNNTMFVITGQTQISKYNVTNKASPTKLFDCYTNSEVISIEGLSDNEVIVGTNNGLRVCDFANANTLNTATNIYSSTAIKTYTNGEIPYEITRLDNNGKYAVAQGNSMGLYFYTKSNVVTVTNQPPILQIITNAPSPYVNQSISVTLNAVDIDTPSNQLFYDYDCAGTRTYQLNHYSQNQFTCTYTTNGTKTINAFVTDGTTTAIASKTFTVTDLPSGSSFLNFKTVDSVTGLALSGVKVDVQGQSNKTSDIGGYASFNLPIGTYTATFTCPNCIPQTQLYNTRNNEIIVQIQSTIVNGITVNQLTINIVDENNLPVQYATVSVTDPVTSLAKIGQTDNLGNVLFTNLPIGVSLLITAKHPSQTANTFITTTNTVMSQSEIKTLTMIVNSLGTSVSLSSGRGCSDYVKGVMLCSPLNINGTGDDCNSDVDCITGRCEVSIGNNRQCSKFNWTYCDAKGLSRGNRCFTSAMAGGTLDEASNGITNNIKYVFVFLILLAIGLIIVKSIKKN